MLRRFDLVCFTIAAFIALDTIAATAAYGGGETLFWVGFIIVLSDPERLIVAELERRCRSKAVRTPGRDLPSAGSPGR